MDNNTPYLISDVPWTEKDGSKRRRIVLDIPDTMRDLFYDTWKQVVEQQDNTPKT